MVNEKEVQLVNMLNNFYSNFKVSFQFYIGDGNVSGNKRFFQGAALIECNISPRTQVMEVIIKKVKTEPIFRKHYSGFFTYNEIPPTPIQIEGDFIVGRYSYMEFLNPNIKDVRKFINSLLQKEIARGLQQTIGSYQVADVKGEKHRISSLTFGITNVSL